jgi:hypothetical protein
MPPASLASFRLAEQIRRETDFFWSGGWPIGFAGGMGVADLRAALGFIRAQG